MEWIKVKGKLIYDPDHKTKKHQEQGEWKRTAMAFIDGGELSNYYAWFIEKRFKIKLSTPLRGTHLTVISDRFKFDVLYQVSKSKYNKKILDIEYNPDVRTDGKHWWLNARCPQAEEIRFNAGLDKKPYFGFHITIGRPHQNDCDQSHYIHDLIKKYGNEFSL